MVFNVLNNCITRISAIIIINITINLTMIYIMIFLDMYKILKIKNKK